MGISDNLQPLTWGICVPLIVITTASCLLRFYSRACIAKSFGLDDWFMVGSLLTWLANEFILLKMITLGGGRQQKDVPPGNMADITMLLFIIEFVYILCQCLIKLSFVFFYQRVLPSTKTYSMILNAALVLVLSQTVGVWLIYGLQCIPINAFFHPELHPNAVCISTAISLYLPASLNVFVDLVIYVLPIYPVWSLQMPLKRRIGLVACFTLGGGTILVSLLRFIVLVQLASGVKTFYVYGSVVIITTIEFCTAIVTANMPALLAVWRKHISKTLTQSDDGKDTYDHEMGNVSTGPRSRKPARGSQVLRSRSATQTEDPTWRNGSEDELFKSGNIVVNTEVDITTAPKTRSGEEIPNGYYNFPDFLNKEFST